jgi:DnaJ-class molecular chaperone
MSDSTAQTIDLEVVCQQCNGDCLLSDTKGGLTECETCNGTGKILTENGRRILNFVWRRCDGLTRKDD